MAEADPEGVQRVRMIISDVNVRPNYFFMGYLIKNYIKSAKRTPHIHIVGSTQHCRNSNFFRNVLFCSFESIKRIYIICENVLIVLLIFLQ